MADAALVIAFALIPAVPGTLSTYLYEDEAPLSWRIAAGVSTALAAFGLLGFVLAFPLGIRAASFAIAFVGVGTTVLPLAQRGLRRAVWDDLRQLVQRLRRCVARSTCTEVLQAVFVGGAVALSVAILDRVLFVRGDGWHTGVMTNFGDLPFHIGVIARFVDGNVPPENPIFAGVPFTYPFLADFITAMPVAAGASMRAAMFAQNFVLLTAFGILLHRWALDLTRDRSAALLSCVLTVASGGLGWWMLVADATGGGLFTALRHLTHDYTILNRTTWRWGNVVTALLIPQRSLLLGLPIALVVFTLLHREIADRGTDDPGGLRRMTACGVIAGLLPLVHAHSFMVVVGIALCLAALFEWSRKWIGFFVAAAIVGLPQILWSGHDTAMRASSFVGWQTGWDHGSDNILWFWFKNTGLLIPLVAAAFVWTRSRNRIPRHAALFYVPFVFCFVVPNLIRLAPWVWDNVKVLVYWFVASTPFVALLIVQVWRRGGLQRVIAGAVVATLTLAGALDLWRVASRAADARVFDADAIAFAEHIRHDTPPHARILHAPIQNHPVFLSGRQSIMGYPGHVWSHGLEGAAREAAIRSIYAGGPDADRLLNQLQIDYVVVGPLERRTMSTNAAFFDRYSRVEYAGGFDLYRVTSDGY